ncbi:hypothetical protein A3860_29870 [Niastella vici]|uniref:Abortive phage resistance protein n=1 Tax=Niastella vici TaxID=1703345 RepID=A0A1V9FUJ4_9BACT|nr:AIPR family protein [Niastella vici]OQP61906.1 hypothetical protein A3860_29870 [Niastella vici]
MKQLPSELSNFSAFLNAEVSNLLQSKKDAGFREVAFTELVLDYLSDTNETSNGQICTAVHRNKAGNRLRQINAYSIWDNYETLDLFITDFNGSGEVYTLDKSKVESNFNLALKYLGYAIKGKTEELEESAPETEFLQNFNEYRSQLLRVRIILLTDGVVKSKLSRPKTKEGDLTVLFDVWDVERINQLWSSQRKREIIEIDVHKQFNYQIKYLPLTQKTESYSTYVSIIPASLLADLYDEYGTRLLEQNVRVYLQNVGKVNKEIRKTILEKPEMFMAYNNGISATATAISFDKANNGNGVELIKKISGFQIVNGGQTTSSVYYARKKDRADLSKVYVQIKITLVHKEEEMEKIVSSISKYANSQNKVSEIDLTSNQAFHVVLEEFSRTTWAPPVQGSTQQTRWFYERVKGQYKEELNKEHTGARKKNFKKRNPAHQVIKKEEVAKYRNAWFQLPHLVSRGSQKNYLYFIQANGNKKPSRIYFRETVAMALFFNEAEKLYGKKPYALGDLRYIAIPYAISWLNCHLPKDINLGKIWTAQRLSPELSTLLLDVLKHVNIFFQEKKPASYSLMGEWAKRDECWQLLKSISPKRWGIDFKSVSKDLNQTASEKEDDADLENRMVSIPLENWELIEEFGKNKGKFSPLQIGVIKNVISSIRKEKAMSSQLISGAREILAIYNRKVKDPIYF